MSSTVNTSSILAPLFIYRFKLIAARKYLASQQFHQKYQSYESITNCADRLRWCRMNLGLMQKEVAEQVGVSRNTYLDMENGNNQFCSLEVIKRLAKLYQVPTIDLLDGYNLFLFRGQTEQIAKHREALGLSFKEYAKFLGVSESSVRAWEDGTKLLSKKSWERFYKNSMV